MTGQMRNLCTLLGIEEEVPSRLLADLLGVHAERPLTDPPPFPSDVADDGTPVEFSIQFDADGRRHLRTLCEALAPEPTAAKNLTAAQDLLSVLAERHHLDLGKLDAVRDLLTPEHPQGDFSWWWSFIFPQGAAAPKIKVYVNPAMHGEEEAPKLVEEAFQRLGLHGAFATATKFGMQRHGQDRFAFFALDLDDSPTARVKLYLAHRDADVAVAERAAAAVPGIEAGRIREFCDVLAPGTAEFTRRPLISSYSFVEGDDSTPSNYSLYLPLRDYVEHDGIALERVQELFRGQDLAPESITEVLRAVTDRPLADNTGLIAHVSLRLSPGTSGNSVYVSSEAYGGTRR
ncbi:tryptophan dimethylallyltransferase family protein [Saccharopolyspora sp. CA-218241]|uniref:tryptophan dimethylallyltransferase family protein n=1 Tax=Saccharopolyspora sp. CA-218241 TaxID=3240027 RepID=UPI003D980DB3